MIETWVNIWRLIVLFAWASLAPLIHNNISFRLFWHNIQSSFSALLLYFTSRVHFVLFWKEIVSSKLMLMLKCKTNTSLVFKLNCLMLSNKRHDFVDMSYLVTSNMKYTWKFEILENKGTVKFPQSSDLFLYIQGACHHFIHQIYFICLLEYYTVCCVMSSVYSQFGIRDCKSCRRHVVGRIWTLGRLMKDTSDYSAFWEM